MKPILWFPWLTATITLRFAGPQLNYGAEDNAVRRPPALVPAMTGQAGI
ncbi:MAG: hypothetical protein ABSG78_09830 [Verrucomicrobiota bacterium]